MLNERIQIIKENTGIKINEKNAQISKLCSDWESTRAQLTDTQIEFLSFQLSAESHIFKLETYSQSTQQEKRRQSRENIKQ